MASAKVVQHLACVVPDHINRVVAIAWIEIADRLMRPCVVQAIAVFVVPIL
jgi:hypothetical protein